MSYGQSNIILLIINIFSYLSVILELICDILDLNLGKNNYNSRRHTLHQCRQFDMSDIYVRRIRPLKGHAQTALKLFINTKTRA